MNSRKALNLNMNIKEFEIPVPWGHIAVKSCGNEENIPVLAVHGVGDNAGSFDRLLPFLPTSFYYICIDLPSHGKSSPYPPHLLISSLDNILTFKLVIDYFNRRKYILMGHSWGGQTAILFTQLYPEHVLKLISLDSVYLLPVSTNNFQKYLRGRFDSFIEINKNIVENKKHLYTYKEALTKIIEERFLGGLSKESAEAILKRSLMEVEDGKFQIISDPRLKIYLNPLFDVRYIVELVKKYPIKCPALFVYTTETSNVFHHMQVIRKEFEKNRNCISREIEGSHDVHNNNPEIVGPIVSQFLNNSTSKL